MLRGGQSSTNTRKLRRDCIGADNESHGSELDVAIAGRLPSTAEQNVAGRGRREEEEDEAGQYFPSDNQAEPRVFRVPNSTAHDGGDTSRSEQRYKCNNQHLRMEWRMDMRRLTGWRILDGAIDWPMDNRQRGSLRAERLE